MNQPEIVLLGPAYNVNRPHQRLRSRFAENPLHPVTITHIEDPKDERIGGACLVIAFHEQLFEQIDDTAQQKKLLWVESSGHSGADYQAMIQQVIKILGLN